jgi:hypothetical protein
MLDDSNNSSSLLHNTSSGFQVGLASGISAAPTKNAQKAGNNRRDQKEELKKSKKR